MAMERFAIEDFVIGDDEGEVEGDGVEDGVEVTSTESILYLYGGGTFYHIRGYKIPSYIESRKCVYLF